jgi:Leucine-rich repeat (LRR) protein
MSAEKSPQTGKGCRIPLAVVLGGTVTVGSALGLIGSCIESAPRREKALNEEIIRRIEEIGGDVHRDTKNRLRAHYISISDRELTDEDLENIGNAIHVEELYLFNTGLSDEDLIYFRNLSNLKEIDLRKNAITGKGLAHIQGAHMQKLWIGFNPLTDDAVEHIQKMENLTDLALNDSNITDAAMAPLGAMKNLNTVNTTRTQTTTEGEEAFLRQKAPGTTVLLNHNAYSIK